MERVVKFYVYFNSKNELVSVSGNKDATSHHRWAIFSRGEVEGFVTGKKRLSDYVVVEDRKTGKIILSKKESHEIVVRSIDNLLYKVPSNNDVYDIKIRNNKREKILTFFLSDNIKNATENTSQLIVNGIVKLHFYFTKKDDPHMLRKHVSVNVEDIFQNNVITNYTETLNNVSVFTKRIYENYLYEEV